MFSGLDRRRGIMGKMNWKGDMGNKMNKKIGHYQGLKVETPPFPWKMVKNCKRRQHCKGTPYVE